MSLQLRNHAHIDFFTALIYIYIFKGVKANVVVGVGASALFDNNSKKLPGQVANTIGYHSKSGLMYYNCKSNGNMMGQKCFKGNYLN